MDCREIKEYPENHEKFTKIEHKCDSVILESIKMLEKDSKDCKVIPKT